MGADPCAYVVPDCSSSEADYVWAEKDHLRIIKFCVCQLFQNILIDYKEDCDIEALMSTELARCLDRSVTTQVPTKVMATAPTTEPVTAQSPPI